MTTSELADALSLLLAESDGGRVWHLRYLEVRERLDAAERTIAELGSINEFKTRQVAALGEDNVRLRDKLRAELRTVRPYPERSNDIPDRPSITLAAVKAALGPEKG